VEVVKEEERIKKRVGINQKFVISKTLRTSNKKIEIIIT
jgi:hypothetical protein